MKKSALIAFCCLVSQGSAFAHGFAVSVSTPISPPVELMWVLPAFGLLFVIMNSWFNRRMNGSGFDRSMFCALGHCLCLGLSFFFVGDLAAGLTTAPPPGLGVPCPAYWGFGWDKVGSLFLTWNGLGLLFVAGWTILFVKLWRVPRRLRAMNVVANLVLYVCCLLPFASSGAWSHGWAGGYVHSECQRRVERLYLALLSYAESHEGRLPTAKNMDELIAQLEPFSSERAYLYLNPQDRCPIGIAYEKRPQPYLWNGEVSGKHLRDLGTHYFWGDDKKMISCPYHGPKALGFAMFRVADQFRESMECLQNAEAVNK